MHMKLLAVEPFFIFLLFSCAFSAFASLSSSSSSSSWKTLHGDAPLVVARGGFSGLFPDSSYESYAFASDISSPDTVLWCDVQLTKDGAGICHPGLNLQNSTTIEPVYANRSNTYPVNGVPVSGWFPVDFTLDELSNVSLLRGILSRPTIFDDWLFPIQTVYNFTSTFTHTWLNIQHDAFYTQHNLSIRSFVLSVVKKGDVNYISSPELQFLKDIAQQLNPNKTQLIFCFLGLDEQEPTTKQTYSSLLKNLTAIKTFAAGILVPKEYVWPVNPSGYLLPHTSVVSDAHNAGLKVFASAFANDYFISYNYSYDPVDEYISFIDNGNFSVDGVLSDFPVTASAAIGCYSHVDKNMPLQAKPLIISLEGASGDYPGCTDMAIEKAISDGAEVIDCPIQMTRDRIPICLGSVNLINSTNVVQTEFSQFMRSIPEIGGQGVYTFDLSWKDIQSLIPQISNPYHRYSLVRNPKARNMGKFLRLDDFLRLSTNATSLSGVLISIENEAYLKRNGYDITDEVIAYLSNAGFDSATVKKVMIQSSSSSVLTKFRAQTRYQLIYNIDKLVEDVLNSTIQKIKCFADAVVLQKGSVYLSSNKYLVRATDMIQKFHAYHLPVYVKLFDNEFVSQDWDYYSDSRMEINNFVNAAEADGIVTSFPKTTTAYKRNKCLCLKDTPIYMRPVEPGGLVKLVEGESSAVPPLTPLPVLNDSDVDAPTLPPSSLNPVPNFPATPNYKQSGQPKDHRSNLIIFIPLLVLMALLDCVSLYTL